MEERAKSAVEIKDKVLEFTPQQSRYLEMLTWEAFCCFSTLGKIGVKLLEERNKIIASVSGEAPGSIQDDLCLEELKKKSDERAEVMEPKTPEEVLRFTALQFKEYDLLATKAFDKYDNLDAFGLIILQERAKIIYYLPDRIKEATKYGDFPEVEEQALRNYSKSAEAALNNSVLNDNSEAPLKQLLLNELSPDKPNDLESFIQRVFPVRKAPAEKVT